MGRIFATIVWAWSIACSAAAAQDVTVFAAASLRGALDEIAAGYDGGALRLSYGGSGTMARQVAAGAPADLVVLANELWMDWLVQQGLPTNGHPSDIASNALVLIGPAGAAPLRAAADLPARLGTGRLAMGQRDAVPAGRYARQWLEHAGLWDSLEPRLAETDNVRAALALVARGASPLGVVYATDAAASDAVTVLAPVPAEAHEQVRYPALALTPAGAALLTYLQGPEAQAILASHGFLPPRPAP